jgi:pimeloyl-ACP methyl ester carboxylesterase
MIKSLVKIRFFYQNFYISFLGLFFFFIVTPFILPVYADGNQCQKKTLSVTLSSSDQTPYHLVGWLCWEGSLRNKTAQLVIHGLTYDHFYWDFPYRSETYSYVRKAVDAGYATFTIDRLGVGLSDRPTGLSLTTASSAYVAHQLVQKLRSGMIGNTHFQKVMLIGHSFGSATSLYEAATYHDVDGVILSGHMHDIDPGAFAVFNLFYPAQLDPKFANVGLPADYYTTMPGTRGQIFYNTAFADPGVIARDELLKQTSTGGEVATLTDSLNPALSQSLTVPVLLAMGAQDILFCNTTDLSCASSSAILARENRYYSAHACLEAVVQPNSGHDLNLHPNARVWYAAALNWANRRVGNAANHPPTQPCL